MSVFPIVGFADFCSRQNVRVRKNGYRRKKTDISLKTRLIKITRAGDRMSNERCALVRAMEFDKVDVPWDEKIEFFKTLVAQCNADSIADEDCLNRRLDLWNQYYKRVPPPLPEVPNEVSALAWFCDIVQLANFLNRIPVDVMVECMAAMQQKEMHRNAHAFGPDKWCNRCGCHHTVKEHTAHVVRHLIEDMGTQAIERNVYDPKWNYLREQ